MTKKVAEFTAAECAAIEKAIGERRSIRAFLDTPVPRELIERLLDIAARAPSGTNMQPWRAHVVVGAEKEKVTQAV
ncbi:MAG: nitroreductase family protein, partial [Hyphomicrobiales bacterium]|nr:nitroreductase family protein [Hyphomicrobiales bacterium]